MGAKGDTFSDDLLKLIFNGTPIANIADNAASGPLTSFYLALHTSDPGGSGNQTTNEISYTGYARIAIARSTAGWIVIGASAIATIDNAFANPTGSVGQIATYASVGTASSGTGKILYRGALSVPITIELSNPPVLLAGTSFTES